MYIRTKNGRIIDTTKIVTGSKFMDFATNDESFRVIFKTEPLAKSENLVELCDGFTYEYCKGSEHERCWRDSNTGKWYDYDTNFKLNEKQILTIKGGIWTEWGLKYVAEMNESGGLKLKWVKN